MALGRPLTLADLDPVFPWWNTERPKYYQGIVDAAAHTSTHAYATDSEYQAGIRLGRSLVQKSNPNVITGFVGNVKLHVTI
jgi:hypothetical protein